jgi:hypothetical protein
MGINNNKKETMMETLQFGRRLLPVEHVALVEPFDPATQKNMKSERAFQARLVLVDRSSILIEETVAAFAEKHGFRMLAEDGVATNPLIHFSVESFAATEDFPTVKQFLARLLWKDFDEQQQSKLLLTAPETVLAVAVRGQAEASAPADATAATEKTRRRRRAEPSPR